MKLFPQQSRIIVGPIPNDDTTIHIPKVKFDGEEGDAEIRRWRVIEVGPGRTLEDGTVLPVPLKEGDEVRFDFRFAQPLVPETWFGGERNDENTKYVVDYAGVLVVIQRDPDEKVSRFHVPRPKPQQQQKPPGIFVPGRMPMPVQ